VNREPNKIALPDATGEPDPQRCLNPKLRYTDAIFNQNYVLIPGRQLCVRIDDRRPALITVD